MGHRDEPQGPQHRGRRGRPRRGRRVGAAARKGRACAERGREPEADQAGKDERAGGRAAGRRRPRAARLVGRRRRQHGRQGRRSCASGPAPTFVRLVEPVPPTAHGPRRARPRFVLLHRSIPARRHAIALPRRRARASTVCARPRRHARGRARPTSHGVDRPSAHDNGRKGAAAVQVGHVLVAVARWARHRFSATGELGCAGRGGDASSRPAPGAPSLVRPFLHRLNSGRTSASHVDVDFLLDRPCASRRRSRRTSTRRTDLLVVVVRQVHLLDRSRSPAARDARQAQGRRRVPAPPAARPHRAAGRARRAFPAGRPEAAGEEGAAGRVGRRRRAGAGAER